MESRLIYDVGMHRGEDTAFYLKKGFDVVAIEANLSLVRLCTERFADEIKSGRLEIIYGAIAPTGDRPTVAFHEHSVSVFGTINSSWDGRNLGTGKTVEVPRIDFDNILNSHRIPYYAKIDIEGADELVLRSMREKMIRPFHISIEAEKVDFDRLIRELNMLRDLGYTEFRAVQQAGMGGRIFDCHDIDGNPFVHIFEDDASGPFGDDAPGDWMSYDSIILEYRRIFTLYKYFGDSSEIRRSGRLEMITELETALQRVLPGWYDTHARIGAYQNK